MRIFVANQKVRFSPFVTLYADAHRLSNAIACYVVTTWAVLITGKNERWTFRRLIRL